jgi:hypothetical protein
MSAPAGGTSDLVISYLGLRRGIGLVGTALPFVLALGGLLSGLPGLEPSISAYYHTPMRDVFVGSLCAIAVFLASYRGPERADDLLGDVACASAIGVALLPTTPADPTPAERLVGALHYASAAVFFLSLAAFCLWLFRKTSPARAPTARKLQRNRVYTVCGWVILGCMAGILLAKQVLPAAWVDRLAVVFWLEAAAVLAFGVSWLVKGELLLADETAPHGALAA